SEIAVTLKDGHRVVVLNDLDLEVANSGEAGAIGAAIAAAVFESDEWREIFVRRFAIVSNDIFSFLTNTGTEIAARVRLQDDTKTVASGALWYEESVPAESIFAAPLIAAPVGSQHTAGELLGILQPALARPLQIGGNASVGKGLAWMRLLEARE
ncbi:MAG: type III-B CRISPR module RAMP protein Cmr4, partial [Vicinamibacterales bacterium]